jgi:hypothetical protein
MNRFSDSMGNENSFCEAIDRVLVCLDEYFPLPFGIIQLAAFLERA